MLKITVVEGADKIAFVLAGRLVGPWVEELRRCWQSQKGSRVGRVGAYHVDLVDTTAVDDDGKALLAEMHRHGAEIKTRGCLMRAIVDGLTGSCPGDIAHGSGGD